MRNLITLNKGQIQPQSVTAPDLLLIDSVFDVVSNSITCLLGSYELGILEVQQYQKNGSVAVLATIPLQSFTDKVKSFAHFADSWQIICVMQEGDIINVSYDPSNPENSVAEIVGSIDCGILAAAWSPDEETLSLVTNEDNVVLLSRSFDPIAEVKLASEDLKLSKHVDVGWGKKETQFRGKGARAMERAALESLQNSGLVGDELRDPTMPYSVSKGELSHRDDFGVEISWRGDCEYFSVTAVGERRVIRVYSRDGTLDSVSEPVDFLEKAIGWKPQGSLIASIQRNPESLDLVFFERNGLRHGEFCLRTEDEDVKDICWNSNSEVLTVVFTNRVQLWTTKNYHWFLKQELYCDNIQYAKWHPEKDFTLMFGDEQTVNIVDLAYKMTVGPACDGSDLGTNLVIDGSTVNITPLSVASVPPPIYYREFDVTGNVLDAAVGVSNQVYAALTNDALFLAQQEGNKHPKVVAELPLTGGRQVAFVKDTHVCVLVEGNEFIIVDVSDISLPEIVSTAVAHTKVVSLRSQFEYTHFVYETIDAKIYQLSVTGETRMVTQFPELVRDFRVIEIEEKLVAFGMTANGKLFANSLLLTTAVTSMDICDSLLLFTTAKHNLQFVHLSSSEFKPLAAVEDNVSDERVRAIERGSILVNVIPSKSSVVLQAPRGNLETICPRIMVLAGVRKDILNKRYMHAFVTCRTHRINLDILHDYSPELFMENLETFILDIDRIDYLDLFVSCLIEDDVCHTKYRESNNEAEFALQIPPETEQEKWIKKQNFDPSKSKVNRICKKMLEVLLSSEQYKKKYLQTIVTSFACQNPPNLEEALTMITTFSEQSELERAVQHLCFLQDVNLLYDVALGLYDIKMALLIAQQSQKDPREYLPFLQNLHVQTPIRRQFLVDDYLKKYAKALGHLAQEDVVTEEFKEYTTKHELYQVALGLFRHDIAKQNEILALFAASLQSKQEYVEAAITWEMLGENEQAMEAYTLGKKWQEALTLATRYFPSQVEETAERLVGSLTQDHKYYDAGCVELQFLNNIEAGLQLYCKSYHYEDAIMVAVKQNRVDLIESLIDPGLGEGFGTVAELLADCKGQVVSQLNRLRELRTKKQEDPYAFYGQDTDVADDVSIAPSETSTKESFFTRYTGKTGGTAKTGASRKTAKNKRREERKRARGKKGTIYEEEYLVKSTGRLIERMQQTQPEAIRLIEGLLRRNMREQALQIQKNFIDLITFLQQNAVEIYTISEKDRERIDDDGNVYYLEEIPVPVLQDFPKKQVLDY